MNGDEMTAEQKEIAKLKRKITKLQKRIEELEFQHALDMSEIVKLRRQVDFLIGSDASV